MYRYLLIAIFFVHGTCAAQVEVFPGYTWNSVGSGIYVHSQNDPLAGPVDGNSVVIVSDQGVLVVDTHINPAVARAVISKIRTVTDKPVTHVVNTHWHDDHTNGNHAYREAFPDVTIVSHRATLNALKTEWQAMEDQRRDAYESVDVEELRRAADSLDESDPSTAIGYRVYAGYVEALRPELPTMKLVYPDTVFEDSLAYDFGNRSVHLEWMGRGNTDGDIVVWLPDDRLLVTGDMLVAPIPYAFNSPSRAGCVDDYSRTWSRTARQTVSCPRAVVAPGHGQRRA
jgi:glyoxylase-like metal-dependent hydrolase (beta-lactamase superfamily II)